MGFNFEKLDVYQKALDFIDIVYEVTDNFPKNEDYGLTAQFRRAAASISLNIAEGSGRDTKADKRRFYIMARGSIFECIPIMEIARRRNLLSKQTQADLRLRCEELSKMISGLIKSLASLKR